MSPSRLDAATLLEHVRTESARFADVLTGADPAARVPTCPDWTAADLAWHLTEVHAFWATVVRERLTDPGPAEAAAPARPDGPAAVLALYDRVTTDLLDALAAAGDHDRVWTWAPEQQVGFVRRFQAHEALMHRVDAELAAGRSPAPVPADLGEDGIDVLLTYSMTWKPGWAPFVPTGDVGLLQATDTGRRWTVALGTWSGVGPESGTVYEPSPVLELRDGGEATFTVGGAAADLDLWLWRRDGGTAAVSFAGDAGGTDRFTTQVARGVQ